MKLKDYLKKERYTVTQFAKELDFSRGFISSLMNGTTRCRPRTARLIERFTNGEVTVNDILSEYKEETSDQNKS